MDTRASHMKLQSTLILFILILAAFPCVTLGAQRTSANYSITSESLDSGGVEVASINYTNDGCAGGIIGTSTAISPSETAQNGYIGQLFEVTAISLYASASTINANGATSQLTGVALLDDNSVTQLSGSDVNWSMVSGPIASISTYGLLTTSSESVDSSAVIAGSWMGAASTTTLFVLNGNYGAYGSPNIPDTWQVQYFGINNPDAAPGVDADGTGQTNLFKYIAGLNPLDPTSRFVVSIQPVSGQSGQKQIVFTPVVVGSTYTVVSNLSLSSSNWVALSSATQNDNGQQRTVTDLSASGSAKFYRVQISRP